MNDDAEQLLERLKPRGVRPEVRPRVLAAVEDELRPASPWLRRSAMAVAASIFLGVALNVWVARAADRRMVRYFGDAPVVTQDSRRAYAEYNAIVQQLLAEMQSPFCNLPDRRTAPAAPRGAMDDRGVKYDGSSARPTVAAFC